MNTTFWNRLVRQAQATLSEGALDIILELVDRVDSQTEIIDLMYVLEDGEALRDLGFNNQRDVEEAYGFLEEYL